MQFVLSYTWYGLIPGMVWDVELFVPFFFFAVSLFLRFTVRVRLVLRV